MTRSLGSTPITRASSLLRTGPPTEPATVLTPQQTPGLLPLAHCTQNQTGSIGSGLLTFRVGAADRARVASMPDTAWPINGHPPSSSRDKGHTPVLMPSISFDTSTANRLRSPSRSLPSASRALFPHRSPRSRHRSRSMWRFEASPRRATSKGQPSSPTQHHISKLRLHRTPLCVRDTHPHLTRHARLFHIAHHGHVTAPAACGGLKPPPQGDSEGPTILHLLHSTASASSPYIEPPSTFGTHLTEEPLGGLGIPARSDQDVEDVAVLVDGPPQILPTAVDRQEHLVGRCQLGWGSAGSGACRGWVGWVSVVWVRLRQSVR